MKNLTFGPRNFFADRMDMCSLSLSLPSEEYTTSRSPPSGTYPIFMASETTQSLVLST